MRYLRSIIAIGILTFGTVLATVLYWQPISQILRDTYFEIVLLSDPLPTSCDQLVLKTDIEKHLQENATFFSNLSTNVPLVSMTITNNGLPCPEKGYIELLVGSENQRQKAKSLLKENNISVPYFVGNI